MSVFDVMEKYIFLILITILSGCKSVPNVDVSFQEKDANISVSDILNPNRQIDITYNESAGKESRAAADSFRLCTEIFAEMPLNIKVIDDHKKISEETDFLFNVEITQSEIKYETRENTTKEEVEVDGKKTTKISTTSEHHTTKVLELNLLAKNQKLGTTLFRTNDVIISTLTNQDNDSHYEDDSFGEMLLRSFLQGFINGITKERKKSDQNPPYPNPPAEHEMLKDYFLSLWKELD